MNGIQRVSLHWVFLEKLLEPFIFFSLHTNVNVIIPGYYSMKADSTD